MKIVNILGGLGNQMFEYTMYLALKEAHPDEEIKVCTRSFGGYGLHNGLEIQRIFGVELPEASLWQLTKLAYPFFNYRTWQVMRHWLPSRKTMTRGALGISFGYAEVERQGDTYYEGYWQNEKNFRYIREKVLQVYAFPEFSDEQNKQLANRLKQSVAVSCHVRRGDYLKEKDWNVCTPDYYARAITEMNSRVRPELYCVFSDDIDWCKENLSGLIGDMEVVYVDWNKADQSFRDMQLMSLCRHNIIANSSFSWWGAWLNQHEDKIVMAPEIWANYDIKNDPICESWVRVKISIKNQ